MTVHKAQGSEWPRVLVTDHPTGTWMTNHDKRRWRYTAGDQGKRPGPRQRPRLQDGVVSGWRDTALEKYERLGLEVFPYHSGGTMWDDWPHPTATLQRVAGDARMFGVVLGGLARPRRHYGVASRA